VRLRYGIESYLVPEGSRTAAPRARAREEADSEGNAAIKGLLVDRALQYEEPLFLKCRAQLGVL